MSLPYIPNGIPMFQPHTCFSVEHSRRWGFKRPWIWLVVPIRDNSIPHIPSFASENTVLVLSYKCVFLSPKLSDSLHCKPYTFALQFSQCFHFHESKSWVLSYICVLLLPKLSNSLHCKPYASLSVLGHCYPKVRNICAYILTNACTPMSAGL